MLLFLIYVNDIVNSSNLKFSLFADDICFIFSQKCFLYQQLIKTANVNDWFKCNKLFWILRKQSCIISFKKKKNSIDSIKIGNNVIERTESINFLGILIHESLDWKHHIANISF